LVRFGDCAHTAAEIVAGISDAKEKIRQSFEIDHYQPLLFIVDSFDHRFDLVGVLERWMRHGRLDNVSPGELVVSEPDLRSFLDASRRK
jgi:phenylalanine-4-hydroxylase